MFFQAPTAPLVTSAPNYNKCCAWSIFLFKNIVFCIFTPKTRLVKENYFWTIWNVTYLKDTFLVKKIEQFWTLLINKKWVWKVASYNFFQCILHVLCIFILQKISHFKLFLFWEHGEKRSVAFDQYRQTSKRLYTTPGKVQIDHSRWST